MARMAPQSSMYCLRSRSKYSKTSVRDLSVWTISCSVTEMENIISWSPAVTKHREQVWCRYYHLKVAREAKPSPHTTITTSSRLSGPFWLMKNSNCNWSMWSYSTDTKLCVLHNPIVGILFLSSENMEHISNTSVRLMGGAAAEERRPSVAGQCQ